MYDTCILGGKTYIDGTYIDTNVYINNGKFAEISSVFYPSKEVIDITGKLLLPGIIDPHVHFELDLGFIKSVDDFYSGTKAAAFGGVTTIIDFLEPTSSALALKKAYYDRLKLAQKSNIDFKFHATIANPTTDLEAYVIMMKSLGLNTLKLFTTYSESNRRTNDQAIIELLKLSQKYDFLLLAHIENDEMIRHNIQYSYRDLPVSRPTESECSEALKLAGYVKKYGGYLYMVHLSSGLTLNALKLQFPDIINQQFIVESCPQYFTFTDEIFKQDNGYLYTSAPPLRRKEEQILLFENIDYIDTIGTDHCAFMKKDKNQPTLNKTPLGFGGIEHSFNVMYYHFGDRIIKNMTESVAKHHKIVNKGKIKVGYDADLMIYELINDAIITENHAACDYSVYDKHPVKGRIVSTILRGKFVVKNGEFIGGKGQLIRGENHD